MDGLRELAEYASERDKHEFALGDTLDIKTGLLLASLTFLAIQSTELVKPGGLSLAGTVLQAIAIISMVCCAILCALELWPRDYMREATPSEYETWLADLEAYSREHPDASALPTLSGARLSKAIERIQTNSAINTAKSRLMFWAFYCLISAFVMNIVTLITRLF